MTPEERINLCLGNERGRREVDWDRLRAGILAQFTEALAAQREKDARIAEKVEHTYLRSAFLACETIAKEIREAKP